MAIQISVDTLSNNITVAPTLANYNRGDIVQWEAVGASSLVLNFTKGTGTPFDEPTITGTAGAGSATAEKPILAAAASASYHYSLTVTIGGQNYTIPGCPEIVVL